MKPIFKYSGGKTRELKRIHEIISSIEFDRVIEPFVGGGAVSFHLEKPALVSDIRTNNIDVYRAVKDVTQFKLLLKKVEELKLITDKKELEKEFYYWRDTKYQKCNTLWEKAFRWLVLRQLCYSGMDRVNEKTGKFNVPYGWYAKFTSTLNQGHHDLLNNWEIRECSFEDTITEGDENDFIFVDPPYLDRNSDYGNNTHSLKLHENLFKSLEATKSKWLLIHTRHPFYKEHYSKYNILTKEFTYASQWSAKKTNPSEKAEARIQNDRAVEHMYITNFPTTDNFTELFSINV